MFLALRDLAYARGRFLLMALVVSLIACLMVLLGGLSSGLIFGNISGLMSLPATHIAFEYDDKPTYTSSMVDREMWEGWAAQPGVRQALPVGSAVFYARSEQNLPLQLTLWGIEAGSFLEPEVVEGEQLGELENGVLISAVLAENEGLKIGETITLDRVLTKLKVIGITGGANIGHVPIVFAHLPKWQEATYGPPGGPRPGEKLPDILFDFASVIALQMDDSVAINDVDIELGTSTLTREGSYFASVGYMEEIRTVQIIQIFLVLISAVVVGAFFIVWTIQRTQELGLVKALGASTWYLMKDSMAQAFILLVIGTLIGLGVGSWLGNQVQTSTLAFLLSAQDAVIMACLVIVSGLVGAALTVRIISSIDPIIALGRDQ